MSYSYIVSYGTSATGPWTQAGTSSVASFVINGLSVGTNYWVQVIAVDSITGLQSSPTVAGPFQTGTVTQESNNLTAVTSSSQTIYSSQTPGQAAPTGGPFDTWTITGQGGQVVHNGVTDTTTAGVLQLFYSSHTVYHEESNGNSFGTPGWWQWTGTVTYPSATPGSGSFTDTKGNAWSLNVSGNPVVNGFTDTVSHAQIIYLIGTTVWQEDVSNNWYSLTPTGTVTSGSLSWTGPTTTSPVTGWASCASPSGVPLTITGISLSNNTVSNTAPSGTTVGAITVSLSSGTFAGSLAVGGANASSFAVSGSNLITSAGSLTAGNYSIGLTATQSSASNSPFGPTSFSIISQASTGGPGPPAFSSFITADFSSAFNYPQAPASGQQVVSKFSWGYDSSSWMDHSGTSSDWWLNSTATSMMGKINPGLCFLKCPTTNAMWNSDLSVNAAHFAGLMNNFYKTDPLGIAGVVLVPYWDGQSSPTGLLTPQQYGTMCANMATYMLGFTMPNGKKFPLIGFSGADEPDLSFSTDPNTWVPFYNALGPAIKAVNSNLLLFGPATSFPQAKNFGTLVTGLDAYCANSFGALQGSVDDMSGLNQVVGTITDWNTATGSNLKYSGFSSGGSDSGCSGAQLRSYPEAMLHCKALINGLNSAKVGYLGSFWGGINDCGLMDYPAPQGSGTIYPIGYWYAQGVRTLTGPRWQVPTNSTGMQTVVVTPGPGRCTLLAFNVGNGSKTGTTALSHWPVNASGDGTANVWQMTSAQNGQGKDGVPSTVPVTKGVTASVTFPDPSITIISI